MEGRRDRLHETHPALGVVTLRGYSKGLAPHSLVRGDLRPRPVRYGLTRDGARHHRGWHGLVGPTLAEVNRSALPRGDGLGCSAQ